MKLRQLQLNYLFLREIFFIKIFKIIQPGKEAEFIKLQKIIKDEIRAMQTVERIRSERVSKFFFSMKEYI